METDIGDTVVPEKGIEGVVEETMRNYVEEALVADGRRVRQMTEKGLQFRKEQVIYTETRKGNPETR